MSKVDDVLTKLAVTKQALGMLDHRGHDVYVAPSAPATPDQIRALEQRWEVNLPASFRTLLNRHNGWPRFLLGVDLLSTDQMQQSDHLVDARETLDITMDALGPVWGGISLDSALVFGVDPGEGDLLFLNPAKQSADGEFEVVWWHDGPIERRDTLVEFLEMVNSLIEREMMRP